MAVSVADRRNRAFTGERHHFPMNRIVSALAVAFRFAGALVVGLVLVLILQTLIAFAQVALDEPASRVFQALDGPFFPLGLVAVLALAVRYAATGRLTTADRVLGTAVAVATAAAAIVVVPVAAIVVTGVVVASFLFAVAGGGEFVTAVLAPIGGWAIVASNAALLLIGVLGFGIYVLWRRDAGGEEPMARPPGEVPFDASRPPS